MILNTMLYDIQDIIRKSSASSPENLNIQLDPLREMCPYSEFFWSVFSCIQTEYGKILCISPYSVRMREKQTRKTPNTDTFYAVPSLYQYSFFIQCFPLFYSNNFLRLAVILIVSYMSRPS